MLFTISGKHIDITEAIKRYAQEKTSRLPRYYNGINRVEVVVDRSKGGKTDVEIIARGEHSKVFVGTESGEDAYKCIDVAVRKLEKQLRRKKTKERNNKHTAAANTTKAGKGGVIDGQDSLRSSLRDCVLVACGELALLVPSLPTGPNPCRPAKG